MAIVALGGSGAFVGYALATLTESVVSTWEDDLALAMALATLTIAAISAVVMMTRPRTMPRGCGLLQITVAALAGVMLLLPVFATTWIAAPIVFTTVVALLAVQVVANLMLWHRADEMLRRVMVETSSLAFWALQTGLFLYAGAERLGLIRGLSAWGMIGILMAVYLLASIVASARRGLT